MVGGLENDLLESASILFLGDRQFDNGESTVSIDVMYRMSAVGVDGSGGIVIYYDEDHCDSYY